MLNGTGSLQFCMKNSISFFEIKFLDGSLFPPNLKKSEKVYSYNADMCR